MLEADNDYFNTGIVDVSHEYEKMYVVRPQFFIQIIGLLRNAALNSLKYKQELALVREQNIDITHFEEDLDAFKVAFARTTIRLLSTLARLSMKSTKPSSGWKKSRNSSPHQKTNFASLTTSWMMFPLKKIDSEKINYESEV